MRFVTACVAALSATGLASAGNWFSQDATTGDVTKVPGDSPLEFCDSDHSKDIVTIDKVDLSPNPPQKYVNSLHGCGVLCRVLSYWQRGGAG
jgi:hypothetical protein